LNLEHKRLLALFDNVAGERNYESSAFVLETLDEQLLNVELVDSDWSVPSQGELTQELAKGFQVGLDLA